MSQEKWLLHVEDNESDILFFRRALAKADPEISVRVLSDGASAASYLLGQGDYADRSRYPFPPLVVLDLKLPNKSGLEILEEAAGLVSCGQMKVVVLTSSSEANDISRAYALGAAAYLVKPVRIPQLESLAAGIAKYLSNLGVPPSASLGTFMLQANQHHL
jgi:CheY-like chemotaxis protein